MDEAKRRISGTGRARITADERDRVIRAMTEPRIGPIGPQRSLFWIPRAWARIDALTIALDGAGGMAWDATITTCRSQNGRAVPSPVGATDDEIATAITTAIRNTARDERAAAR